MGPITTAGRFPRGDTRLGTNGFYWAVFGRSLDHYVVTCGVIRNSTLRAVAVINLAQKSGRTYAQGP